MSPRLSIMHSFIKRIFMHGVKLVIQIHFEGAVMCGTLGLAQDKVGFPKFLHA